MKASEQIIHLPRRLLAALLRAYQYCISPLLPPSCRFYPSCSEYARQSVLRFGLLRGGLLALRRLLKCHPFHPGGCDPVPSEGGRRREAGS